MNIVIFTVSTFIHMIVLVIFKIHFIFFFLKINIIIVTESIFLLLSEKKNIKN